jgi:hypothetical protein
MMKKWGASRSQRRRGPRSYPEPASSLQEAIQRAREQLSQGFPCEAEGCDAMGHRHREAWLCRFHASEDLP